MKCLTVRQPYAWAILFGQKDVENRTRNIAGSYRGPLLIHAAKRNFAAERIIRARVRAAVLAILPLHDAWPDDEPADLIEWAERLS